MPLDEEQIEEIPEAIYYSNSARVVVSPFDVRIDYLQRAATPKEEGKPQATIYMSMEHAKSLAKIIIERIAVFEKDFKTEICDPISILKEEAQAAAKKKSAENAKPAKRKNA